jgi:hypothetical protein
VGRGRGGAGSGGGRGGGAGAGGGPRGRRPPPEGVPAISLLPAVPADYSAQGGVAAAPERSTEWGKLPLTDLKRQQKKTAKRILELVARCVSLGTTYLSFNARWGCDRALWTASHADGHQERKGCAD